MPQDIDPSSDAPLRPPADHAAAAFWRWLLAAGLVLVIVVGAYRAYQWLVTDVERRRAVAEAPAAAPPAQAVAPAAPAPRHERPPAAVAAAPREAPPAPAVTGTAIHKCVAGGQVTYSNQPCVDGASAEPLPADAAGVDANGVTGSVGDGVPVLVTRPAGLDVGDPGQQGAVCGYLAAEIERLDFEFKQPLPPAVIDHISSQLAGLRAQHGGARCGPLPKVAGADDKPAPAVRKRPPAKVLDEKRAD